MALVVGHAWLKGRGGAPLSLPVSVDEETVWLSQAQMCELFDRSQSVIARHIKNAFSEGEIDKERNMQIMHIASSERPVSYYNLDVVISVGYRVKSRRGVEFRRWATGVLREYVMKGHVENRRRLEQLGQMPRYTTLWT